MKRRKSLILLFILVFTGVALISHTQAWADYNVLDRACSPEEKTDKVCAEHFDADGKLMYVTQIYVNPSNQNPTVGTALTDEWPIKNPTGGPVTSLTWQYSIVAAVDPDVPDADALPDCKGVPSSNFVYWELVGPLPTIIDSDPDGATLLKTAVKNCDLYTGPAIERLKLNPEYQCKLDKTGNYIRVVFSVTTEVTGIDDRCAKFSTVTRDGCSPDPILAMQGGTGISYSAGHTVYCGENKIVVTLDECNGLIKEVAMSGANYVCPATVGDLDHAWIHVYSVEEPPGGENKPRHSFPSTDAGPRDTGFGVCLEPPEYTDEQGDNKLEDLNPVPGLWAYPTAVYLQGDNSWYGVIGNSPPYPDCILQQP